MGPELMLAATVGSAAIGAGGTLYKAKADADAMNAQAGADQARAAVNAQWSERRANEERVAAQSQANNETRAARLAQSRLGAVAGASGSGASDPTVMDLWEGIEAEGQANASKARVAGEQKATGMTYQAALDRWSADSNAAIKRAGAKSTLIGGFMSAGGKMLSPMAMRYGGPSFQSSGGSTGYDPSRWSRTR